MNIEFWGRSVLNYFQQVQIDDVIEGKKDGTGRRGRRCKQPLDDVTETGRYWVLNEEALDCILRRTTSLVLAIDLS